jgi:hypothetical protein
MNHSLFAPLTTRELVFCFVILAWICIAHIRLCKLNRAYINDNFGCYTRLGGIVNGSKIIKRDRRKIASGKIVLIACDVAGMGLLNSKIGEIAVNNAVKSALLEVKSWRGVKLIAQVNSGDEFAIILDSVDAAGVVGKLQSLFVSHGFKGVYTAITTLNQGYQHATVKGMETVYNEKRK